MILQVFSVYDSAVGSYLQPFFVRSRGEALRSFGDACNDEKNNFYRHSSDYSLVWIGEFDDGSGTFNSGAPVRIINASECQLDADIEKVKAVGGNGKERGLPM